MRLSAPPKIGMRTRWSASAATSAGRPQRLVAEQPRGRAGQQPGRLRLEEVELAGAVGGQQRQPRSPYVVGGLGGRRGPRRPAGGTATRPRRGPSWGCRGRRCGRPARPPPPPRRRRSAAPCRRCPGRARRRAPRRAGSRGAAPLPPVRRARGRPRPHPGGGPCRSARSGRPRRRRTRAGPPARRPSAARAARPGRAKTSRTCPPRERLAHGLRSLGQEQPGLTSTGTTQQLARRADPAAARGQPGRLVRLGHRISWRTATGPTPEGRPRHRGASRGVGSGCGPDGDAIRTQRPRRGAR